jgi:hypothetical protein
VVPTEGGERQLRSIGPHCAGVDAEMRSIVEAREKPAERSA